MAAHRDIVEALKTGDAGKVGRMSVIAYQGSADVSRTWRVAIDLSAPRTKADQVFTRVRDRWKSDRAVVSFDLIAVD